MSSARSGQRAARRLGPRRRLDLTAGALLALSACGSGASPPRAPAPTAPAPPPLAPIDGVWSWTHVAEADGVRTVEHERWTLRADGPRVGGSYRRTVTFLALDGVPFVCNQDTAYRLVTEYRLEGERTTSGVTLEEVSYRTAPSPCDRGLRQLARYQGTRRGDSLHLTWEGGEQTLARAEPTAPPARATTPADAVAGQWIWTRRGTTREGYAVVEREVWSLEALPEGAIHGHYERVVTVVDPSGEDFPCSNLPAFEYRDRYRVRGVRAGRDLYLDELAAEVDPSPCVHEPERRLDAATGRIVGEHLILEWRGRRAQVLRRPRAAP